MIAPDKITVSLPAGQVLSLTCSSDVAGTITELVASVPKAPVVVANGQNYGPFGTLKNYSISISVGTLQHSYAPAAPVDSTALAAAIALLKSAGIAFTTAVAGIVLKRGANGLCGTVVANGASAVAVANTNIAITDFIGLSLNTVGGTVGVIGPTVVSITAGVGFSIKAQALDTSTYNYAITKNAA